MVCSNDSQRIVEFKALIDMGQSTVFVKNNQTDRMVEKIRSDLCRTKKVIYIDCENLANGMELAEQLCKRYQLHFFKPDCELPEDEFRALDYALSLLDEVEKIESEIVVWMDNFTEVLKFDKGWVFNLLRGSFQHHQNVLHLFTSDSKEDVNKIFMHHDNAFFRFARII